jgi:hypothetical protein
MELGAGSKTCDITRLVSFCIDFMLQAPRSKLVKLRRPCRRAEMLETGFVDLAEETDKVPFTAVLANNT